MLQSTCAKILFLPMYKQIHYQSHFCNPRSQPHLFLHCSPQSERVWRENSSFCYYSYLIVAFTKMRQIATISRKKTAVKQFFFCSVLQVKVGVQVLLIQSGLGLTWDGLAAWGGLHLSHLGSSEQQQVHVRLTLLQILASLWNGKHLENLPYFLALPLSIDTSTHPS